MTTEMMPSRDWRTELIDILEAEMTRFGDVIRAEKLRYLR